MSGNRFGRLVAVVVLTWTGAALTASGAIISGTIRQFGIPVISPTVLLTAYKNSQCAELAGKKEKTQAETDQLTACKTDDFRATTGTRMGTFEFTEVPAGWYSLTITWPQGNVPIFCSESPDGWSVRNVERDGVISVRGTSSPFEIKETEKLEKNLTWCR
ncbi:MAG TPA: hypothetical protein VJT50_17105 [Pyrinomonadaceae bacterium]|nr:hypothetical protein [Pyrinomonadaceae bacterium]